MEGGQVKYLVSGRGAGIFVGLQQGGRFYFRRQKVQTFRPPLPEAKNFTWPPLHDFTIDKIKCLKISVLDTF